jgi:phosphatidylethanolamine/phosphatidyl-N-methylethanolamine N-methyltransferase
MSPWERNTAAHETFTIRGGCGEQSTYSRAQGKSRSAIVAKPVSSFFREFVRQPGRIGAIAASSSYLAREMVDWFDWPHIRTVVELGPGTGAFTQAVLSRKTAGTRFFAVELNNHFVDLMRQKFSDVAIYHRSAIDIPNICCEEGIDQIDAIVCGLPWASFPDRLQIQIIDAVTRVLGPTSQFATFAYLQGLLLPAGQRFRRRLEKSFGQVNRSRIVWRNLPPAFIYRCRRPMHSTSSE